MNHSPFSTIGKYMNLVVLPLSLYLDLSAKSRFERMSVLGESGGLHASTFFDCANATIAAV
jgi:hypothetical protein